MLPWPTLLAGIPAKNLRGSIYEIDVCSMGPADVGPYDQLLAYVKQPNVYKMPVNVHHIVGGEHLDNTGWIYATAPCVVLDVGMHRQYHGRFTETLTEHGGRGLLTPLTQSEKLELYHDIYAEQAGWRELWKIAARIITGSPVIPNPRTFVTP